MEILDKGSVPQTNFCECCSSIGTSRCGRCHTAFYCSRDHQILHWSVHKKVCKRSLSSAQSSFAKNPSNNSNEMLSSFQPYGGWCQNDIPNKKIENVGMMQASADTFSADHPDLSKQKPLDFNIENCDEIFSSLSSEILSSDNPFWEVINDPQTMLEYGLYLDKDDAMEGLPYTFNEPSSSCSNESQNNQFNSGKIEYSVQCAPLNDICSNIVHDLNKYGICVLDKFIGSKYGNMILEEVKNLYTQGIFTKGELVNSNPYMLKEVVRSDVTTWVDGSEPGCKYIGNLIRKLDVVVTTCNKMADNGILAQYKLHRRTKAMIACYPGNGTYYKKHIDNPHRDGRCITCIYYLNQNWDIKLHGGLLRMFPAAHDSHVANIEPIFDRMLFFWSDKRNPHEVLPSYSTRFAITVWYFDADERDRALMMSRDRALKSTKQSFVN